MEVTFGPTLFFLEEGDITRQETEAIVNAANSRLAGGGGVDGAIHRAGGPAIMEECRKIGHCPTGQAVITTGGNLKAKYVIHTVGPIYRDGMRGEEKLLAGAYRESLKLAQTKGSPFGSLSVAQHRGIRLPPGGSGRDRPKNGSGLHQGKPGLRPGRLRPLRPRISMVPMKGL